MGFPWLAASACEGMGLTHRKECMIADTPEAFTDAMVDVFEDTIYGLPFLQKRKASLSQMFIADAAEHALF